MDNSLKDSNIVDCWTLATLSISIFTHSHSVLLYPHTFSFNSIDSLLWDFNSHSRGTEPDHYLITTDRRVCRLIGSLIVVRGDYRAKLNDSNGPFYCCFI